MKQQLLTICLLIASVVTFAQTPRLSLYEEFTGETCPPCATYNPALNSKLSSPTNTPLVVAIKWQVKIPSAPSAYWSLYQSNKTEIDWRAGSSPNSWGYPSQDAPTTSVPNPPISNYINSAPQGRLDGQHVWAFGAASDHIASMTNSAIAVAQSYTSAFSIVLKRELDQLGTAFNVTVNILATAPFTSSAGLVFRTVMIENLVQFKNAAGTATASGSNGEKKFESPVVKCFPSVQTGVALPTTWVVGQTKTFTLNCPIPAYMFNTDPIAANNPNSGLYNFGRQVSDLDFVGFIQDNGNKKVAQAVRGSDCQYVTASVSAPLVCEGDAVTLSATGGTSNYTWSNGQTGANITVIASPDSTTWNLWATSSDPGACINRAEVGYKVTQCTGIKGASYSGLYVNVFPNPSKGEFVVKGEFSNSTTSIVMYNTIGQKVYEQALIANETSIKANLAKGVYTYDIIRDTKKVNNGKLVIE